MGQARLRTRARRHRSRPLLDHEPALGRRLARVHRHRGLDRATTSRRSALGSAGDYIFKLALHLVLDHRRDRLALREVDPDGRRVRADPRARLLHADPASSTPSKHGVHGFAFGDLSAVARGPLRPRPGLLFNYVGFELQNGAAEEMVNPQKDVPIPVLRSGILGVFMYASRSSGSCSCCRPARSQASAASWTRSRSLHGLRRRVRHALRPHGARLHLHADDLGRGLDDRFRPDPGRCGLRRLLSAPSVSSTRGSAPPSVSTSCRGLVAIFTVAAIHYSGVSARRTRSPSCSRLPSRPP